MTPRRHPHGDPVRVELTGDEALVLFDWLHRQEDDQFAGLPVRDHAERIALWAVSAGLEAVLVEPFDPDYAELVRQARDRLRPATGSPADERR